MPTLTSAEILSDVIGSFRKNFPALNRMGTDFRPGALKLNQTYTAHIPTLPSVATYDTTTGYANGAQAARSLLVDVPITVNTHKHVPIKWLHLDAIKDQKNKYEQVIDNAGYVLAKAYIDDLLSGVTAANFSEATVAATATFDLDVVTAVSGAMNLKGAVTNGRVLLVSTAVANILGADARIASRDYHGQQTGGSSLRSWSNVGGFAEIIEYPDMPTTGNLTAFAFEARAFATLAGIPEQFDSEFLAGLNIPRVMGYEAVTRDGVSMAAVSWQEAGTGNLFWSPTMVWGKALGKQGGSAGALCDYAGHRIVSA